MAEMLSASARRSIGHIVTLAALVLAVAPAGSQAFSKAIWGPVFHNGANQFPIYRQLGVSIYEADLYWSVVAPTRPHKATDPLDPAYRWPATLDQALAQARLFHMRVMLQIIGTPGWANGGRAFNWVPLHPSDYGAFATAAARRYPGVQLWMVWGEPNRHGNFMPETKARPGTRLNRNQQVAPHNYARLLDAAYGALKHVSASNQVIGGSTFTTGDIDTLQWIENLKLPNGRPPRIDMYAHNPFGAEDPSFSMPPSGSGVVQFSDLPILAGWVDRYLRRGIPLFLSEYGIPTAPDEEFPFWVDKPVAAKWIRDAMRLSRGWPRIYALGWIHVYDDPPLSFAGLLNARGVRKPLFSAFAYG
jgi:hypothetical protein